MLFPLRFMEACRRRYGDVVSFRRPFGPPWVIVFDPASVERIYRAPADRLSKDKRRTPRLSPVIGERSMALKEGPEYMRNRRLIRPALHGRTLEVYEAWIRDAADRMIDAWPVGRPFALLPWTTALAVDVSTRVILGVDDRAEREALAARLKVLADPEATRPGGLLHALSRGRFVPESTLSGMLLHALSRGRFGRRGETSRARRARLDQLIREVIAKRRGAEDIEDRTDVLSLLLTARDEDGRGMSDQEVCDHVVTLLVGGRINPSVGLASIIELLLRNPAARQRLRDGLAAGDESYLEAVVKETLRIRSMSLTPVSRIVADRPFRLGDYVLQPETTVSVGGAVIHRRPDVHPEPDAFRPERFLGSPRGYMYSWVPFGGGTRRCPGANFSTLEMGVVARRVLERAHLAPVGRRPEGLVPKGAALRQVITFVPARGARVVQTRVPEPVPAGARPMAADRGVEPAPAAR
jgi:cytochrome P450